MTPKETAMKIAADFDDLTAKYQQIMKILLDAMSPDTTQEQRDELRKVFAPLAKK